MAEIRPLRPEDIGNVAQLFQTVFRDPASAPPPGLVSYLRRLYLEMPGFEPEVHSLVHEDDAGAITGFIGVNMLRMRYRERSLLAAVCGSLMVKDHEAAPMAGARLLRAALAGPQDLTLSGTANAVSTRMWCSLRSVTLPFYSLDWTRIIRPASFAADKAARTVKAARFIMPVARGIDHILRRHTALVPARQGSLSASQIGREQFAALVEPLTRHYTIRPDWADGQLDAILADAERKSLYGEVVFCQATTTAGVPVGAFLYHLRPGGVARVLQVLARPGQAGAVLDCLTYDAARRGAIGLRGRTQPALVEVMYGRRMFFTYPPATSVVHSREAALVEACRAGDIFFNGLVGEDWSRLMGDRFD